MPSKEFIAIAMTVVGAWYITGGHQAVKKNIRKVQIAVLKDIGRTSKWGNPVPWHYRAPSIR